MYRIYSSFLLSALRSTLVSSQYLKILSLKVYQALEKKMCHRTFWLEAEPAGFEL